MLIQFDQTNFQFQLQNNIIVRSMQRKNQSLLITNNTKKENSLKKIIQDYQQDQSKDYKLVVLGNRMQIQEPQDKNWFQLYSNMQGNSSLLKNKSGLFSAYLSNVNAQKKHRKNAIKQKVFQNKSLSKQKKEKGQREKYKVGCVKQNCLQLPLESNMENQNENESMLNNFTLSFNDGSVGKIKHQFIEMQPSSEINKKQDSSRIYYQKEEYSYGNPYAKEIVDEDSRESLKNIVNCLNETTKNNQNNQKKKKEKEPEKEDSPVRQIQSRVQQRGIYERSRQDTVETGISMNKRTQSKIVVQNQIEFDLSLDCINV